MLNEIQKKIYQSMTKEEKAVVDAIQIANALDEFELIDKMILDVQARRARLTDVVYVDLSIDRSNAPLEISGAGTALIGIEATDNNANLEISLEVPNGDTNTRIQFKRGKRYFGPFSKIYIYHSAQAGKSMKLMRCFATRSVFAGFEDDSGETANSDLVIALGNSSAIATNQVAVGTSATVIKAANSARKRIKITNNDAGTNLYIGASGVTTSNGDMIPPYGSTVLNTTAAIYGVGAVALTVSYLEE